MLVFYVGEEVGFSRNASHLHCTVFAGAKCFLYRETSGWFILVLLVLCLKNRAPHQERTAVRYTHTLGCVVKRIKKT